MDSIDEQWLDLDKQSQKRDTIVAISNTGKYRRADGTVGILNLRHKLKYYGELELCSRIIAENFLITVRRPDQTYIDHITHYPSEYNVNDVRNLRWCTKAENCNFDEAKENYSIAHSGSKNGMYGRTGEKSPMYGRTREKNPAWKGDDVGPMGAYKRAKKLYKAGKITEEELQPYRNSLSEYRRAKKKQSGEPSSENLMG